MTSGPSSRVAGPRTSSTETANAVRQGQKGKTKNANVPSGPSNVVPAKAPNGQSKAGAPGKTVKVTAK